MKRKTIRSLFVLLLTICLCLSGCSKDKKPEPEAGTVSPVGVSGTDDQLSTPQPVISSDAASILPELPAADPNAASDPNTAADPNAASNPNTAADPNAVAGPNTAPESAPVVTPIPEPVTVVLTYDGQEVTALSFMTSSVFQLQAKTSNGSSGGTWTSSDASSASVDENGVVTCWKVGSPRITYTQGEISASCALTITEPRVAIYFAGQPKTDIVLNNIWGFEIQFVGVVTPEGSVVTWSSDDSSIASVDDTGKVVAHKIGSTQIHARCGTADAACWVRVLEMPPAQLMATPDPMDSTPRIVITYVGVAKPDMMMAVGDSLDMEYLLYNIDPATAKVKWTISDPAYASVDKNGVITAIKPTFNAFPGRNYVILTAACGNAKYETAVFIKEAW